MPERKLYEKRVAFTIAMARLLVWAADNIFGYQFAFGEGYVALTDGKDGDYDGPHKKGGAHYTGLGVDLVMYDMNGKYITHGDHPAWHRLGEHWKFMDPDAVWGGDFAGGDANHFSLRHNGVA